MQTKSEVGYGKRLRTAREARGLSPSAVAEKLHLRIDVVLAIEQEEQPHELAPAFVRGYIRAYSQLVAENANELVGLFNRHAGNDPELTQLETIESFQKNKSVTWRWGAITAAIILLAVFAFWLQDYLQKQPSNPDAITGTDSEEPAEVNVVDSPVESGLDKIMIEHEEEYSGPDAEEIEDIVQMVTGDQAGGAETVSETVATATTGSAEQPVLAARIEAAPAQSEPQNDDRNEVVSLAPAGGDRLLIAFDGPSWIEATDANGFRLIYGLFDEQDRQLSVRGKAPFRIIVGDTNNVEIRVNNTKHELRTYTRPNNSARVLFGDQNQRSE